MRKKKQINIENEKTQEEIEKLKKKLAKQKTVLESILKKLQKNNKKP